MEIEKLDDLPHQEIVHVENEFQQALLESQEDYQHLTTETYYDAFSEYVDNEEEHLNISRISFEVIKACLFKIKFSRIHEFDNDI